MKITKNFIYENSGCYNRLRVERLSFMQTNEDFVYLSTILESDILVKHKAYFMLEKLLTPAQSDIIYKGLCRVANIQYEESHRRISAISTMIFTRRLRVEALLEILIKFNEIYLKDGNNETKAK